MTSEPSPPGAVAAEAAPAAPRPNRRPLWLAIGATIVLDILAVVLFAPPGFPSPKAGILANLELIPPTVVLDLAPGGPAPTGSLVIEFHPSITSTILVSWIVMAVLIVLFVAASRGLRLVPGALQNAVEFVYESFADFALSLGGPAAQRYVGLFAALFLFILLANWTDLLLFGDKANWLRTPTSDVNITVGLALVSFCVFHFEGIRALGLRGYLGKFFNFRGFRDGPVNGAIDLFVGLIEFLLEFFKPVTLAFRLFGNLYGGGIMLGVFTALLLGVLPLPFVGLEAFIGFVQALIFSVLTLMFTMIAIEGHAEEAHAAPAFGSDPEGDIGPPLSTAPASGAS